MTGYRAFWLDAYDEHGWRREGTPACYHNHDDIESARACGLKRPRTSFQVMKSDDGIVWAPVMPEDYK